MNVKFGTAPRGIDLPAEICLNSTDLVQIVEVGATLDLRIQRVVATPVEVPLVERPATARLARRRIDRTIVEIETADGIVGVGETRGTWSARTIRDRFVPALLGLSARHHDVIRERCLPAQFDYGFPERDCDRLAFAAFDLALWDIVGQAEGKPLVEMLGGAAGTQAHFGTWLYPPGIRDGHTRSQVASTMAREAENAIASTGTSLIELKIARNDVATDIAVVQAVRAALGPQVAIAVDANMAYALADARSFIEATGSCVLTTVEEPVRSLKVMSDLGVAFGAAISSHCLDLDVVETFPGIRALVPDVAIMGGLAKTIALMRLAVASERGTWLRAVWELGISWAAMVHVAAACPFLTRPSQSLIDFAADDLIEGAPWLGLVLSCS